MASISRTIAAPPERVRTAFTNSTALREWFADVAVASPQKGGRLYLAWGDGTQMSGRFAKLGGKRLVWDFSEQVVEILIEPTDGGSEVTVNAKGRRRWWERAMDNLASVLETGEDLRLTRRPMLGVFVDEVVETGVLLGGVVEGMGAERAGLAKGDVVARLAGRRVTTWLSLGAALSGHRSGEVVEVEFRRAGEKHEVELELSGRPARAVPLDVEGLVTLAQGVYAQNEIELPKLLADRSEEEATRRPQPDAWSAKEIVAHLLATEQYQQWWLVSLLAGAEPFFDESFGNSTLHIAALAASYPTAGALVEELLRSQNATLGMLTGLPEEFVAARRSMWRVGWSYPDTAEHLETHREEIRAALGG